MRCVLVYLSSLGYVMWSSGELPSFTTVPPPCRSHRWATGLLQLCLLKPGRAELLIFINVILLECCNEYLQIIMRSISIEIKWYKLCQITLIFYVFSARDAKMRECFEKIFPELKKQREDKERVQKFVICPYCRIVSCKTSFKSLLLLYNTCPFIKFFMFDVQLISFWSLNVSEGNSRNVLESLD